MTKYLLHLVLLCTASAGWCGDVFRWSFDEGSAENGDRSVTGKVGQALQVTPDIPASRTVPSDLLQEGALSFFYRLPEETTGDVEVLRLGPFTLRYLKRRLSWFVTGNDEGALKRWSPTHSYLTDSKFILIEIGWSEEQRCTIFVDGLLVTWMETFELPKTEAQSISLALLDGIFDQLELADDALNSGSRYQGPIILDRFDDGKIPPSYYPNKSHVHLVDGFNGSKHALATPPSETVYQRAFRYAFFRMTPNMWHCLAVKSSNGSFQRCIVRVWPKLEKHPNHWFRSRIPSGIWQATKTPLERFGLQHGSIVGQFSFGSRGRDERQFLADNVCLYRGTDTTPPGRVEGLEATVGDDGVRLRWKPVSDDICIAGYRVYWSNISDMQLTPESTAVETLQCEFTHQFVTHAGDWYYTVAAVDLFGNVGKPAPPVKVNVK